MLKRTLAIIGIITLLFHCQSPTPPPDPAYLAELDQWRDGRIEALKAPDGWLALTGLYWLKPGENSFGADSSNQVVLPAPAPARMGLFVLEGDSVRMEAGKGTGIREKTSRQEVSTTVLTVREGAAPAVLQWNTLEWVLIERGGRYGIRIWDTANPLIQSLDTIPHYPVDPAWRVEATLVQADTSRKVTMQNILGMTITQQSAGLLRFEKDGKAYELEALYSKPGEYFFIIADETTGSETYSGGRYLYAPAADAAGKTWIDFNRAENPPCAFTKYATCLLPPAQNRLPIAVKAGELNYGGH